MRSYTATGSVYVPEKKIETIDSKHRYEALRGYSASLAVFDGARCVGWIDTRALGYETAKDWLAVNTQGGPA